MPSNNGSYQRLYVLSDHTHLWGGTWTWSLSGLDLYWHWQWYWHLLW